MVVKLAELNISQTYVPDDTLFGGRFAEVLEDVSERFSEHWKVKKDSWQEKPLNSLIGDFSDQCQEFWDKCPDNVKEMYSETLNVLLIMTMIAERLRDVMELGEKLDIEICELL